jgi:Acyl-CoA dehydrogenase, C-terminal domain
MSRFELPQELADLRDSIAAWNARRDVMVGFDNGEWQQFLRWDLLPLGEEVDVLGSSVGLMEVARRGLPGPVLEAWLAAKHNNEARLALGQGAVVSTFAPGPPGPTLVAWGAVAQLIVDPTGAVVARGPAPLARTAYVHPHGWIDRTGGLSDSGNTEIRWCIATALVAGLLRGSLDLTLEYSKHRTQFGRPLASFQGVQFSLAECHILVQGCHWMAMDTASRLQNGDPKAGIAAALGWLAAVQSARSVREACHQVFGAAGLANESKLNELTWSLRWLSQAYSAQEAREYLAVRRIQHAGPECLVLESFA